MTEFSPGLLHDISGVSGPDYLGWICARGYDLAVIRTDGPPVPAGQDVVAVMDAYARRGTDHIDVLATPR